MTIVFLVTKAFVPPISQGGPVLLDVVQMEFEPGGLTDKMYKSTIPDFPHPTVFVLGSVGKMAFEQPRLVVTFSLILSKYVHRMTKTTMIKYVSLRSLTVSH